jgi:acetyl/propionyl-CoA carboxylase alpha subunit
MLKKILTANRSEIARQVIKTARRMGGSVVFSAPSWDE